MKFQQGLDYFEHTARLGQWFESIRPWAAERAKTYDGDFPLNVWLFDVTNDFPKEDFNVDYRVVVKFNTDWGVGRKVNNSSTPTWSISWFSKNPNITRYLMNFWMNQTYPGAGHSYWHTPFDGLWEERTQSYYSMASLDIYRGAGCKKVKSNCWDGCGPQPPKQTFPTLAQVSRKNCRVCVDNPDPKR